MSGTDLVYICEYYKILLERTGKSGLSKGQETIIKTIISAAESGSATEDFYSKMRDSGLYFQLSRAAVSDNWMAKAKAARELDDNISAGCFKQTGEAALLAATTEELNKTLLESNDKNISAGKEQDSLLYGFTGAIYAAFEHMNLHAANNKEIARLSATKLVDFISMEANPFFRGHFSFSDDMWKRIESSYKKMLIGSHNKEAAAGLKKEQDRIIAVISSKDKEMASVQGEIDSKAKRCVYLEAIVSTEPADYIPEKIWER